MKMADFDKPHMSEYPNDDLPTYDTDMGVVVQLAANICHSASQVQVHQASCRELGWQCTRLVAMISTTRTSPGKSDDPRMREEAERVLSRINQWMQDWTQLGFYQSIFRHNIIKDGVDFGLREVARCLQLVNQDSVAIEYSRPWEDVLHEDRMTLCALLQSLTREMTAFRAALQGHRHNVPAVMESIQIELKYSDTDAPHSQNLRRTLWELHEETNELPPLLDLAGQVSDTTANPVVSSPSSDIYTGMWLDKEKVALKQNRLYSRSMLGKRRILQGIETCRNLRHQHILPFYGVLFISKRLLMVSPWMCHGNVNDFLTHRPDENKIALLLQVSDGLEYLHENSIVHGNIRGTSVLISEYKQVKLADFGLSGALDEIDAGLSATGSPDSVRWTARELIRFEDNRGIIASAATDSWSFAMLCLEVMTRHHPFSNILRDVKVYSALTSGALPSRPEFWTSPDLNDGLWQFMCRCWDDDPQARPSMSEAHRFLTQQNAARKLSVPSISQTSPVFKRHSSLIDRRASDKTGMYQTAEVGGEHLFTPGRQHHSWVTSSSTYGSNGTYASSVIISPVENPRISSWLPNGPHQNPSSSRAHSMYRGDSSSGSSMFYPNNHQRSSSHHLPPTFLPKPDSVGLAGWGRGFKPEESVVTAGAGMLINKIPVAPTELRGQVKEGKSASTSKGEAPKHVWRWGKARKGLVIDVPTSPDPPQGLLLSPSTCPTLTVTGTDDELVDAITACGPDMENVSATPIHMPPPEAQLKELTISAGGNVLGETLIASPETLVVPLPPDDWQMCPDSSQMEAGAVEPSKSRFRMVMHRVSKSIPAKPRVTRGIVFGRPLEEVLSLAGETVPILLPGHRAAWVKIPTLVTRCGFWLKTHGLHEIGIFRRCDHNSKSVKRLRAEFERAPDYGKRLDMTGLYTAGHAALVLLAFLSELPEPVIPLTQYDQMLSILDQPDDKAVDRAESALRDMDPSSRELLLYICDLIVTFAKHGPKTSWRPSGPEQNTNMTGLHDLVLTFRRMLLFHPDRILRQHEERRVQKTLMFFVENLKKLLEHRHIWHQ